MEEIAIGTIEASSLSTHDVGYIRPCVEGIAVCVADGSPPTLVPYLHAAIFVMTAAGRIRFVAVSLHRIFPRVSVYTAQIVTIYQPHVWVIAQLLKGRRLPDPAPIFTVLILRRLAIA